MKIRVGFVSNSSSTSFIIIGAKLGPSISNKMAEELMSKGRLYAECGDNWDEADFFPINKGMWKSYKKYNGRSAIEFYDVQKMVEGGKVKKDEIEDDVFSILIMEVSYHSCETIKDFEERHLDMPMPEPLIPEGAQLKLGKIKSLRMDIENLGCDLIMSDGELDIKVKDED